MAGGDTARFPLAAVETLAALAAERHAAFGRPIVLGLGGGQGAGKSTLAAQLVEHLHDGRGLRAVAVSLDDFYFTRAERERLAASVHPELRTRGSVGTHDVELAARTLRALGDAAPGQRVSYPRFDKATDDRVPADRFPAWTGPTDVVILEGVYVGAEPEPEEALEPPLNAFEREQDGDGRLRRHANAQLAGPYRELWALLDALVFLKVPDLEHVLAWRTEQERATGALGAAELARFVQRFERVTRHMLATMPARADVTLELGADHAVAAVRVRG